MENSIINVELWVKKLKLQGLGSLLFATLMRWVPEGKDAIFKKTGSINLLFSQTRKYISIV